jgi:hypothetical protein
MRVGLPITESFIAYDNSNHSISGLTFSHSIYNNGVSSSVSALIVESLPSVYSLTFTPTATGHWLIEMVSASATLNGMYFVDQHDIDQAYPLLSDVWKIETGKWIISGNQLVLYDGNTSTVLYTFDLFDSSGSPSMTGVASRIPV